MLSHKTENQGAIDLLHFIQLIDFLYKIQYVHQIVFSIKIIECLHCTINKDL
jgi:hypothetical protein